MAYLTQGLYINTLVYNELLNGGLIWHMEVRHSLLYYGLLIIAINQLLKCLCNNYNMGMRDLPDIYAQA